MRGAAALVALEAARKPARYLPPGAVVYHQEEPDDVAFNLISGWAMLTQSLPDGRRQVLRFLLPGAVFGPTPEGQALHGSAAEALTPAVLCVIPREGMTALRRHWPEFDDRLLWCIERDAELTAGLLTSVGQRTAIERVAYLLVELAMRALRRFPLRNGDTVALPLTQTLIAEATGLTAVHVNRMLRDLRQRQVAIFLQRRLTVLDAAALLALASLPPELPALWTGTSPFSFS